MDARASATVHPSAGRCRLAANAEVARTLFLGPGTVRWHTVRIYQKISASGRAEAAAYAARHGLVNKQG